MSEQILGLDLGISSIGWAIVNYDEKNYLNNKIIKSGVRIFNVAENPKTGESLAMPRRLARGSRRTLRRKKRRINAIKKLFIKYLNLSNNELFSKESIYNEKNRKDVWLLRDKALKRELTNKEFARVLTHIAKRRGYKSNRKAQENADKEGKKVLGAIEKNKELLINYSTIGQAIFQSSKESKIRRNKKDDYLHSVSRDMLEEEIKIIFKKQKEFGNSFVGEEFRNEYINLFLKQKDFASVDDMVGNCTFEKKEKRAAKASFSAEKFVTLTKLINTKLINKVGFERHFFKEELETIIKLCLQSQNPTYKKIREVINLEEETSFKNLDYQKVDDKGEFLDSEKEVFKSGFIGFHTLRKEISKEFGKITWQNISVDKKLINQIATIFSYHKSDDVIKEKLQELSFSMCSKDEKEKLINHLIENIHFDKFINLSIKAIDKLLVHMEDGLTYDKAVDKVGYKLLEGKKEKFLRALNKQEQLELTNPVLKRAIAQTRKVVNALIRKYGQFDKVHIELTREIKKTFKDRKQIEKQQKEYQVEKENIVKQFNECFKRNPKGNELLKFRLWKEQNERCIYSGEKIDTKKLIEDIKYAEIDHILPFSRSLEDGMSNKVLCLAKENQNKKNRTPYEYYIDDKKDWHWFEEFIKGNKNIKKAKRDRLLKKNFDENSAKEFRERNKNDTAYMAKFIKNFIEENLELTSKFKQKVFTRNGALTSMLRHNWGVSQKTRDTHLHHAQDAIILAFSTQSEVQKLSTYSAKRREFLYKNSEDKSKELKFPKPMDDFRDEVQKSIEEIFVSFAPRKSVTGAAHKETIYSKKLEKTKGIFEVNNGLAENGEVKRVDIFKKDDKFHFVFLYPFDFLRDELPNKTIKNLTIDDSFEFVFSLFKDEFIEIKVKNKDRFSGYFKFCLSDGRFAICNHIDAKFNPTNNRYSTGSLEYIKKYQVDPLGNKVEVKNEKRVGTKKQRG